MAARPVGGVSSRAMWSALRLWWSWWSLWSLWWGRFRHLSHTPRPANPWPQRPSGRSPPSAAGRRSTSSAAATGSRFGRRCWPCPGVAFINQGFNTPGSGRRSPGPQQRYEICEAAMVRQLPSSFQTLTTGRRHWVSADRVPWYGSRGRPPQQSCLGLRTQSDAKPTKAPSWRGSTAVRASKGHRRQESRHHPGQHRGL
jgi:hypothetical protein